VKLELETCPREFNFKVAKVIDPAKVVDPRAKYEVMVVQLDRDLADTNNGDIRVSAEVKGKLHYFYFFLNPRMRGAVLNQINFTNAAYFFPLKAANLADTFVGRVMAITASKAPWTPLPHPFP
jgi:hypothetical protein